MRRLPRCEDAKQEWLDAGMKKIESLWGGQAIFAAMKEGIG